MAETRIPMIIPTVAEDYRRVPRDLGAFFTYLPISEIVFIGPEALAPLVKADAEKYASAGQITFLNENDLIPYPELQKAMRDRLAAEGYGMAENSKPGWYYQQFLKMAYADRCDSDYYMSWDADTLPLRKVEFWDPEGHPYFDTKKEYKEGYFRTIENLFGFGKTCPRSYISEHMVFSVERMQEMRAEIMELPLQGDSFYEKIFFGIDLDNLKLGFSEFETYGTWMENRHPGEYLYRNWKSLRRGNIFIRDAEMEPGDYAYLSKDYDAVTFERYHSYIDGLGTLYRKTRDQGKVGAEEFYHLVLQSGIFGKYDGDGGIEADGGIWSE